jgi:predicted nucleic acid-binding protein
MLPHDDCCANGLSTTLGTRKTRGLCSSTRYKKIDLPHNGNCSVPEAVVFDAGVLGQASHPRRNLVFAQWFDRLLATNTTVYIAEIADYEVRRELLRAERHEGVARLDRLKAVLPYLPISTATMLRAARLWAEARKHGVALLLTPKSLIVMLS